MRFARSPISGMLLCGLFHQPEIVLGIRHPNADRPLDFDPLPGVPFCEVIIDQTTGVLSTKWN
jgi:hypothetical protein